jgi:Lrp/AsnC family transcriptional regulator, leucine-responsive regulatory protein
MSEIDSINQEILREIVHDGRMSNTDLAQKVGLSPSACLRRVHELERKGIIKGYRAIIDQKVLGGGLTVYVAVGLSRHLKSDQLAFERAMSLATQVRECHMVSGVIEYMLRIEVADLDAFKYFHSEVLGTLPLVSSIVSYFVMESSKDERG